MIVEDKSTIRKGIIKMIDASTHGIESVVEASNGKEALELAKSSKLHIILTDIRMPDGDGITLLSNLRNMMPDIQTIVISGYDDFDFVKKAMIYGSVNYILKPTDPIELNESISKAISIIKEREEGLYDTRGKKIKCFQKKLKDEEFKVDEADLMREYENNLFIIGASFNYNKHTNIHHIHEGHHEFFGFSKGKLEIFLYSEKGIFDSTLFEKRITEEILNIQKQDIKNNMLKFGIGTVVFGIDKLKQAYDTAIEALTYTMFIQNSTVISYYNIKENKEYSFNISDIENDLTLKVTSGNVVDTIQILNELFENIITNDVSIKIIRKMLISLCLLLNKLDTGISEEILELSQNINNPEYILSFQSFDRIKDLMCNLFQFATRKYTRDLGNQKGLVENVTEYVEKNYSKEISLQSTADNFHVNSSYLSNQFKKYTRKNFNFYLNEVRIEKAKDLLKSSDIKLQQISELVGYKDQVHFCKVFKKFTGITPKEFKAK